MPVLAVLNQKGGCGKTTIALNLAAYFSLNGESVQFIDADPQATAMDWNAIRTADPLFPVVGIPRSTLHRDMPKLAAPYAWTVIDGPPLSGDVAKSAIMASDFVLIPMMPSPFDIWSAQKIVDLVAEAQAFKPEIKVAFAVSRKTANTAISKGFRGSLVAAYPESTILLAEIGQRVAFVESAAHGLTVIESEPRGAAAREIKQLAEELKEQTNGKVRRNSPKAKTPVR